MKRLYRIAITAASTVLGGAFGWGVIALLGIPLAQHFSDNPFSLLFYLGFVAGIGMTFAVLGGLLGGLAV